MEKEARNRAKKPPKSGGCLISPSTAFASGYVPDKSDQALLGSLVCGVDQVVDGIGNLLGRSTESLDDRGVRSVLNELLEALDEVSNVVSDHVDAVDDLIHDLSVVSGHGDLLSLIDQSLGVLSQRDAMGRDILQGASNALQNQEREGVNQRADNMTQRRHGCG